MDVVRHRLELFGAQLVSEELLERALLNQKIKFDYTCAIGHLNHKTVISFRRSQICIVCSGRDPEDSKRRFAETVRDRGWTTDLDAYRGSSVKVTISCSAGHCWEAKPCFVLQGNGCSRCSGRSSEQAREKLAKMVEARNGKVDIETYKNAQTKLVFTCSAGHEWKTTPGQVFLGRWCPRCSNNSTDLTKEKLVEVVARRGGKIDIGEYISNKAKMSFECTAGHRWEAVPKSVINGHWCRACSVKWRKTFTPEEFLEKLTKAVEGWGGSFDSTKINSKRMEFTCSQGHSWTTHPGNILHGTQCSRCRGNNTQDAQKALVELVEAKGGKVDMSQYRGVNQKVQFTCAQGHQWSTTPNSVTSSKTWCLKCAGLCQEESKKNLEQKVKDRGGSCCMDEYVNSNTRMTFTCEKGHSWKTTPGSVAAGSWCAVCAGLTKEQSIQRLVACVAQKNGKVDISMYKKNDSNVRFTCESGHEWFARPANVLGVGTWCPYCRESKGEREIRSILEKQNIIFVTQKVLKGTRLKADFFIESRNLIVEFDGEQHFSLEWRGKKTPRTRENDLRKNAWCVENNVNLLRVPWWTMDVEKVVLDALTRENLELLKPPQDYYDFATHALPLE